MSSKYDMGRRMKRGFTLVELMVVMAIAGVLMMLAMPAFTGISGSAALNGAANELNAVLKQARQNAMTNSEITYVVFPESSSLVLNPGGTSIDCSQDGDEPVANRSYMVFSAKRRFDGTGAYDFKRLSNWYHLPQDVVFFTTGGNNNVFEQKINVPVDDDGIDTIALYSSGEMATIAFGPTGGLLYHYSDGQVFSSSFYLIETSGEANADAEGKVIEVPALTGRSRIYDGRP